MPIRANSRRNGLKYNRPSNNSTRTGGKLGLPGNKVNRKKTQPTFVSRKDNTLRTSKSSPRKLPGLANLGGCAPCRKAAQMRAAARANNSKAS